MIIQNFSWPQLLTDLIGGNDMSQEATAWAMEEILEGNVSTAVMAAFMVALRAKGETVAEIAGLADGMLAKAKPIQLPNEAVDIVGSGGDRANTVNISTMAAIVAAAAGAKVIKHGNRAASSMAGTADTLEALGAGIYVPPEAQQQIFDECGLVFLFAPMYHSSLRFTAPTRRELGVQTTFNFLGPLTNPARPLGQAIGIANRQMAELVAGVLTSRGARGLVFHGYDGLDEITTTSRSDVWIFNDDKCRFTQLNPLDLGIQPADLKQLVGGAPSHNAEVVRNVMAGQKGPVRDVVCLNAAAALLAFEGPDLAVGLAKQLLTHYERANQAIDSGQASDLLDRWIGLSAKLNQKF